MGQTPEQEIARLIAKLPPAPSGWVLAAQQLPAARAAIDGLVEQALADAEARKRILADLEGALRQAGVEPSRAALESLRTRLDDSGASA
jgi:hypothetical protein